MSRLIDIIEEILIRTAKSKKTITYSQLIREINENYGKNIPDRGNLSVFILTHNLQKICMKYTEMGKPMLGSVVVSSKDGYPSVGFFKLAERIYKIKFKTDESKKIFWQNELKKVYTEFEN